MSLEFTIRRAVPSDAESVLCTVASISEAPDWSEQVWRGFLEEKPTPPRVLLLASTGADRIRGLLAGTCVAGRAEVESVLVESSSRRQGVSRALLQTWLGWATALGAEAALLEVRSSHTAAISLYESAGFHVEGHRKAYYRDPTEDALLMGRRLGRF